MRYTSTLLSAAALVQVSIAGYALEDDYMTDFYGAFDFWDAPDPTNGFVKYVDMNTAQGMGLMNSTPGVVSWSVDTTNPTPDGRPSIRLTSKKIYETGLVILDVAHMPTGCGTWPAFWMVGPDWPASGEIDILEGVNEQTNNAMTLHTGPGCSITDGGFTGTVDTPNCDVKADGQSANVGCSIKHPSSNSYGTGLNTNGGGVYATQWTDAAINMWFFARGKEPADVLGAAPDPSTWGTPDAHFANTNCDIGNMFKKQQIVFDTTFCGDWAGAVWTSGTCASKAPTCIDYVRDNPSAFTEAGWTINALKVYQENANAPAPVPTEAPAPSAPISTQASAPAPLPTGAPVPVPIPSGTGGIPVPKPTAPLPPVLSMPVPSESRGPPVNTASVSLPVGTAPVNPSIGTAPVSPPVGTAPAGPKQSGNGQMPGFNFPGRPGNAKPSTVPSATGVPVMIPVGGSNVPVGTAYPTAPLPNVSTGTTVLAPAPTGVEHSFNASMPSGMPGMKPPVSRVVSTVYNTVFVTVTGSTAPMGTKKADAPLAPVNPVATVSVPAPASTAPVAPAGWRIRQAKSRQNRHFHARRHAGRV